MNNWILGFTSRYAIDKGRNNWTGCTFVQWQQKSIEKNCFRAASLRYWPGPLNYRGRSTTPSFRHWNHCREMSTANENECGMQPICLSLTLVFKNICLNRENIQTAREHLSATWQTHSSLRQCMKIRRCIRLSTSSMSCGSIDILDQVDE